jgi:hypothetical protein
MLAHSFPTLGSVDVTKIEVADQRGLGRSLAPRKELAIQGAPANRSGQRVRSPQAPMQSR